MNLVYDIMRQFIEQEAPDLDVVVTTDPETAFTDVDFVFAQIRQGGLAMRSSDEKIPLKYGCVGQETCGAGGSISYGIRSIPGVFGIVEAAKKYSPELLQPCRRGRGGDAPRVRQRAHPEHLRHADRDPAVVLQDAQPAQLARPRPVLLRSQPFRLVHRGL